jgi:SAM-dependent methyltransferase
VLGRRLRDGFFGDIAALYDERRPGYPAALYHDLLAAAPGSRRALEAGAGTGKATAALARRGLSVVAVEPDSGMARVARAACAGLPVTVVELPFEEWRGPPGAFDLVISAQAWHWVETGLGLAIAAQALRPDGVLALWWSYAGPVGHIARESLDQAYHRWAPQLAERSMMNRPTPPPLDTADLRTAGFGEPETRYYEWTAAYSAEVYIQLLQTHSDHRLLAPRDLTGLLEAVAEVIDTVCGGTLVYPYRTELRFARSQGVTHW